MERQRFIRSSDGTRLFTSSSGEGPAIIMCDGIGCDGFVWRYIQAFLRPRYRVIRWHYRGHGQSDAPADVNAVDMNCLRSDLHAVMEAYQLDKAVLMAHSMGVQLILDYALTYPERVQGLVPMCGSFGRLLDTIHENGHIGLLFPLLRDLVLRWPGQGQQLWRRAFNSRLSFEVARRFEVNTRIVQSRDFWPYFEHLAGMDARLFVRMLDRVRHHTVEDRLEELNAPTLVIAGERDTFTPAWLSRRMHMLIPDAELLVVPGGTHVAPIEIPELINLRLERFLDQRVYGTKPRAATAAATVGAGRRRRKPPVLQVRDA